MPGVEAAAAAAAEAAEASQAAPPRIVRFEEQVILDDENRQWQLGFQEFRRQLHLT